MNVNVIDIDNKTHTLNYHWLEYPSLMELIVNSYYTEIGECKGRGLCGTCIVEIIKGFDDQMIMAQEKHTLKVHNATKNNRLACQISLDNKINGAVFKELI
ncbi:MAG: Putidaredoxin [Formosa sp. Hel1_33_131]|jgi:2Fe-2S ferredoxin|nr:MAG: Putidaredoxin [Formosa sp. Hel1_33_131]|tara:strand:+ start:1149 stop:1451 length:303 start_codon:yes stop_codon:yes gene_type:complete